jgi:hypothetical protein
MRTALLVALCSLALAGCAPPPQSKPLDESATRARARAPSAGVRAVQGDGEKYDPSPRPTAARNRSWTRRKQQDKEIDDGAK